jgi:hypothetical protein
VVSFKVEIAGRARPGTRGTLAPPPVVGRGEGRDRQSRFESTKMVFTNKLPRTTYRL